MNRVAGFDRIYSFFGGIPRGRYTLRKACFRMARFCKEPHKSKRKVACYADRLSDLAGMMRPCFQATVLRKYTAQYEVCGACGYLRAHEPHWLKEAYSSAVTAADTGLVARNIALAGKVAGVLYWALGERGQGRYLDAAGGYGMLTRLMRDWGFDFYWADEYCENLLARGFEYGERQRGCRAVTAMEVMEHLTDPLAFVDEVLRWAEAGTLIFTYEGQVPGQDWWYYAFPTGQHIGFFTKASIKKMGERLGLRFFQRERPARADARIHGRTEVALGDASLGLSAVALVDSPSLAFQDHG